MPVVSLGCLHPWNAWAQQYWQGRVKELPQHTCKKFPLDLNTYRPGRWRGEVFPCASLSSSNPQTYAPCSKMSQDFAEVFFVFHLRKRHMARLLPPHCDGSLSSTLGSRNLGRKVWATPQLKIPFTRKKTAWIAVCTADATFKLIVLLRSKPLMVKQIENNSDYKMHFYKMPFLIFGGFVLIANNTLLKLHSARSLGLCGVKI